MNDGDGVPGVVQRRHRSRDPRADLARREGGAVGEDRELVLDAVALEPGGLGCRARRGASRAIAAPARRHSSSSPASTASRSGLPGTSESTSMRLPGSSARTVGISGSAGPPASAETRSATLTARSERYSFTIALPRGPRVRSVTRRPGLCFSSSNSTGAPTHRSTTRFTRPRPRPPAPRPQAAAARDPAPHWQRPRASASRARELRVGDGRRRALVAELVEQAPAAASKRRTSSRASCVRHERRPGVIGRHARLASSPGSSRVAPFVEAEHRLVEREAEKRAQALAFRAPARRRATRSEARGRGPARARRRLSSPSRTYHSHQTPTVVTGSPPKVEKPRRVLAASRARRGRRRDRRGRCGRTSPPARGRAASGGSARSPASCRRRGACRGARRRGRTAPSRSRRRRPARRAASRRSRSSSSSASRSSRNGSREPLEQLRRDIRRPRSGRGGTPTCGRSSGSLARPRAADARRRRGGAASSRSAGSRRGRRTGSRGRLRGREHRADALAASRARSSGTAARSGAGCTVARYQSSAGGRGAVAG